MAGFRRARVPVPRWLVAIVLVVLAPPAHAAIEVTIEGVEGDLLDNVRGFLSIVQRQVTDAEPARVRRLHTRARDEIRRALEPFGYYRPVIHAALERTGDDWRARYRIEPGERVRLEDVAVEIDGEAATDPAFDAALAALPLRAGEPLAHADYETAKQRLMALAAERGYVEARWNVSALRVDPEQGTAEAVLVLASGPRYSFGAVRFADSPLSERFLERYLRFEPGDPFHAERLRELRYALDDSNYFRRVDVRARRDQATDGRIPVEIELEPRPKHRYAFGVGYGTDTGARVSAGRETRYVNSRGHAFRADVQVAEVSARVSTRYTIPLGEPWRERLELDTAYGVEDIGDGRSRQFQLGGRRITTSGGWRRSLSLHYERSIDEIGAVETTNELVIPGIGIARSRFDDPVYASRGYRFGVELTGGTETFGSDVSFLRLHASGHWVRRIWSGGRLLVRTELGRVRVDDVDELPLSQRFFAGGDQSVRGFDYQSLGPRNAEGQVVGGTYLAVGSIELEQMLSGNWGAALFFDAGNAMNDPAVDLREAAGIGLRYRSPVGVFRVDVARTVDGDESPRLHLGLGVDL